MSDLENNIPKLIYVMGIDGSGKSTVSEHLAEQLRKQGYSVDILWLRFNHVLSKPLLGFCRLFGFTKYETCDGIRVGYHDFYKSSIVSYAFIFFQYLDALRVKYTKILPAMREKNKVIILDRYVFDILIDVAVDTRKDNLIHSWIGKQYRKLLPHDTVSILVRRDLSDVLNVRPEGVVDRNFESRYHFFESIKDDGDINTIENSGTLNELLNSAMKITRLKTDG